MVGRDEKTKRRRLVVERVDGGEELRIRAKRYWPGILFLPIWLAGWSVGLAIGVVELTERFELVSLLWLALWAAIGLLVAALLGWYLAGVTVVRVAGGDLEIGFRLLGLAWTRRYAGREVRGLAVAPSPPFFAGRTSAIHAGEGSCIRFEHRGRTVHAATGLDEAEARTIVEHLARRLPAGAVE